jgi:hypothetical protein
MLGEQVQHDVIIHYFLKKLASKLTSVCGNIVRAKQISTNHQIANKRQGPNTKRLDVEIW